MANQYTARVTATLVSGSLQKAIEAQAKNSKVQLGNITADTSKLIADIQKSLNSANFTIKISGDGAKGAGVVAITTATKKAKSETSALNAELTKLRSSTLSNNIQTWMNKNAEAGKKFETQLRSIQKGLADKAMDGGNLKLATAQFRNIQSEASKTGLTLKTLHSAYVNLGSATKNFMLQMVGLGSAYQIGMRLISTVKQGVSTVVDLDTALVDLRKTAKMSGSELADFYKDANTEAKNLGVTTKEIIEQAAAWSRLGYSTANEVKTMSRLSSQFAQISPGMSVQEAQESLVSTMKAFGFETDDVLDGIMSKVNILGNSFALSNKDLADALQVSSSSMKAANNSFEQTLALITAGTEITQDASRVGNGLRTISMRIRGLNEETGDFDESLGNVKNDISELTHGMVSIMADDNTYKSTYEILQRISEIWDQLTDKEQAGLLEKLFGKNRAQIGAAILSNFDAAEEAMEKMKVSAGNADKEMSIIMDSLDYKLNRLKETGTGIWQNLLDRGEVGNIVDGLTKVLGVIENITGALGGLGTILTGGALITAISFFTNPSAMLNITTAFFGITSALPAIAGVAAAIAAITIGFKAWKAAHPTLEEIKNDAEKAQKNFSSMETKVQEVTSRIEELNQLKANGTITEAQEKELENLQNEIKIYEQQLELLRYINEEKQKAVVQKTNDEVTNFFNAPKTQAAAIGLYGEEYGSKRTTTGYGGLLNKLDDYKKTAEKISELTQDIADFREAGDQKSLDEAEKLNDQLTSAREKSVQQLEDIMEFQKQLMDYRETLVGKEDADSVANLQLIDDTIALISEQVNQANPLVKSFADNWKSLPQDIQDAFENLNVDELTEDQITEIIHWMDECGYSVDDLKANLLDLNDVASETFAQTTQRSIGELTSFRDELAQTSQALADYNAAMEGGEKGDTIASMQEIYKGAMEDISAGRIDSNRMHAAAKLFFSDEQLAAMNYDMAEIGRQMQSSMMKAMFDPSGESAQSAGQRMVQYIKDNAAKFQDVAGVIDNGNGKVSFWYNNIKQLADAFGMSEAAMQGFLDEWDAYGVNVMQSSQDTAELIQKFQTLKQNTDSEREAIRQLIGEMQASGSDQFDIMTVLNNLRESGAISASVEELKQAIQETNSQVDQLDQNDANPEIRARDFATNVIENVRSRLRSLNGTTATTTVETVERTVKTSETKESNSSSNKSSSTNTNGRSRARASGGRGPGGDTLVNELGPELISDDGKAFIANGGKPGFTHLTEDAIVFTAEETKEILGNGRMSLPAKSYAQGTRKGLIDRLVSTGTNAAVASYWKCPNCGSNNDKSATVCWKCKTPKSGAVSSASTTRSTTTTTTTSSTANRINSAGVSSSTWQCQWCGNNNPTSVGICQRCSRSRYGGSTQIAQPNMWQCSYCGHNNPTSIGTCERCSRSRYGGSTQIAQRNMWQCSYCGHNNPTSIGICENCRRSRYGGSTQIQPSSTTNSNIRSLQDGGFIVTPSNTSYNGGGSGAGDVGGYTGDSGGDSVGGSDYQSQAEPEKIDWVAVAINRIQRAVADLQKVATSGFKKLSTRLNASKKEIVAVTKEIDIMQKGYQRYLKEAESVGLDADLAAKVRDGTIDINKYDEGTRKLIAEYQEW